MKQIVLRGSINLPEIVKRLSAIDCFLDYINVSEVVISVSEKDAFLAEEKVKNIVASTTIFHPKQVVTLIGKILSIAVMAEVFSICTQFGAKFYTCRGLSARQSGRICLEISLSGSLEIEPLRLALRGLAQTNNLDIFLQDFEIYNCPKKMIAFDLDSTLIQMEGIDEIAKYANTGEEVAKITEFAMRGNLGFVQSFKNRVKLLAGTAESSIKIIQENFPLTEGVEKLLPFLKKQNIKIAILSGGFHCFADILQNKFGVDFVYANNLEVNEHGKLTGNYLGEIIDGNKKAYYLDKIMKNEGFSPKEIIAVGDGANDLPMLSLAGTGIAFQAKPIVKEKAQFNLNQTGLDGIWFLLGFSDAQVNEILTK